MEGFEDGADIDQTADAECLMPLIHETEVAELQNFIQHQHGLYFQSNSGDESTPLAAQEAEWNRRFLPSGSAEISSGHIIQRETSCTPDGGWCI